MQRIIEEAEPPEDEPKRPMEKNLNAIEQSYYKLSKPMLLTNFFVNKPRTTLSIALGILVIISVIDVALNYFAVSVETNRDFLIWDDIRSI